MSLFSRSTDRQVSGRPGLLPCCLAAALLLSAGCGWVNRKLIGLDAGEGLVADVGLPDDAAFLTPDAGGDAEVPQEAGPEPDADVDAFVEAGPQPCTFAGTWVAKTTMEMTWPATTGIEAGSGPAAVYVKYQATEQGGLVPNSMVLCGGEIPDFELGILFDERYGINFNMPWYDDVPSRATVTQPTIQVDGEGLPGDPITMSPSAQLLGVTLSDPLTDVWPERTALMLIDMDLDGKPGVTIDNLNDATHVYMRVDALGTRAARGYYTSRVVHAWNGTVVSCTELAGAAEVAHFDTHFVGCGLALGGDCSAAQTATLDQWRPLHMPQSSTFRAFRVADDATCADARNAPY